MNKVMFISAVTALSFISGVAGAVTLKNTDKTVAIVGVDEGGKKATVEIMPGITWDNKGKDASFTTGSNKPVVGKGDEKFVIKNGKVEAESKETKAGDTAAPAASNTVKAVPEATGAKH